MDANKVPALRAVTYIHHAAVRFEADGKVVYSDPFKTKEKANDADLILITHDHGDHYSPGNIKRLMKEGTRFCATAGVAAMLREDLAIPQADITVVEQYNEYEPLPGVWAQAVPAWNQNHPAGTGVGYVMKLDGFRYYLSGDTDTLEQNAECDVLFCVCDGRYNMPDYLNRIPAEIRAMRTLPGVVVPYHYDNARQAGNGRHLAEELNRLGIPALLLEDRGQED